jgi:hypothetical protein
LLTYFRPIFVLACFQRTPPARYGSGNRWNIHDPEHILNSSSTGSNGRNFSEEIRGWLLSDDAKLISMQMRGQSWAEIGKILRRDRFAVRGRYLQIRQNCQNIHYGLPRTNIDRVTAETSGDSRSEPGDCDGECCSSESDSLEGGHTASRQSWMIPQVGVRMGSTDAVIIVCYISNLLVFSKIALLFPSGPPLAACGRE